MKSIHIQARLHQDIEDELPAIRIYQEWEKNNYSAREILTRALLALGKQPMPEKPETLTAQTLRVMLAEMRESVENTETLTAETLRAMLAEMRESLSDTFVHLLDTRLEELSQMSPTDRRRAVRRAVSSFGDSIEDSLSVHDFGEEDK